jgi:hypothetical protein
VQLVDVARAEVAAQAVDQRLPAGLGRKVRNRGVTIDVDEVGAIALEAVAGERLGKPPSSGTTNGR